jgi:hypothetical protein
MTAGASNIHATAIVVGKTGLLFVGPSGWGKSMLAFACVSEGNRLGIASMLVADDQVLISQRNGAVIAECPPTIAGLIELRGTGIVRVPHVAEAPMHYAGQDRVPPEGERAVIAGGIDLPAIRLLANAPLPLAALMARVPDIGR